MENTTDQEHPAEAAALELLWPSHQASLSGSSVSLVHSPLFYLIESEDKMCCQIYPRYHEVIISVTALTISGHNNLHICLCLSIIKLPQNDNLMFIIKLIDILLIRVYCKCYKKSCISFNVTVNSVSHSVHSWCCSHHDGSELQQQRAAAIHCCWRGEAGGLRFLSEGVSQLLCSVETANAELRESWIGFDCLILPLGIFSGFPQQ